MKNRFYFVNSKNKNGKIKCSYCKKYIKKKDIVYNYDLDLNTFDWWSYSVKKGNFIILKPKHWYGYIGYVPILREIPYLLHKWFHKKKIFKISGCKRCEKGRMNEK